MSPNESVVAPAPDTTPEVSVTAMAAAIVRPANSH
jgi:hypothetical protein